MVGAIVGTIAIVLVTVAIGIWIDRKKPLLPRPEDFTEPEKLPPPQHAAGEAPATAIPASESQLANLRSSQRCTACRARMADDPAADDRVRYDDRDLLVLHFTCDKCGAKRSLYVEPVPK
ncbi:MAG: hypothetical protein HOV81_12535 [Kofleriaceae bacterium]|nr:hypothetical protein [Kofleriaceae bacterium]